jgi:uncharacterized protein
MNILIEQLDDEQLKELGVFRWPVWEKEESKFDWYYDSQERCYILEGSVDIITEFEQITLHPGDFVTFPKGLECVWDINSTIRKHYSFD